jgi:hypothetical protein
MDMCLGGKRLDVDAQHVAKSLRRQRRRPCFLVTQEINEAIETVTQGWGNLKGCGVHTFLSNEWLTKLCTNIALIMHNDY